MLHSTNLPASRRLWLATGLVALVGLTEATFALSSPLAPLNDAGFGTFNGKLQLLAMRRHYLESQGGLDAAAGTIALTLDWKSPDMAGFSLGVQGIACPQLFEAGSHPAIVGGTEMGQGWLVFNDAFYALNNAWLQVDFAGLGLEGTTLRVGRQPLNFDFFQPYAIRQKAQAIEGAVLETALVPNVALKIGFFGKYSSWSTRDNADLPAGSNDAVYSYDFETIEDSFGLPYSTGGVLFLTADLKFVEAVPMTVYDMMVSDVMNVIGFKASATVGSFTPKLHVIHESDAGKYADETGGKIDATLLDFGVKIALGKTAVEPGYLMVKGDKPENTFQAPFRTSLTADPLLLWMPRLFNAGANTLYVKATSKLGKLSLYGIYATTSFDDIAGNAATDSEVDAVIGYPLLDGLTATVKAGYGSRNNDPASGPDASTIDTRLFVTWSF